MRRWNRPLHDFILPYVRDAINRITGANDIPGEVRHRRDPDTLADMLAFLRAESLAAGNQEQRGRWTEKTTSLPSAHTYFSRAGGRDRKTTATIAPAPSRAFSRRSPRRCRATQEAFRRLFLANRPSCACPVLQGRGGRSGETSKTSLQPRAGAQIRPGLLSIRGASPKPESSGRENQLKTGRGGTPPTFRCELSVTITPLLGLRSPA
jgi:hypothetical protein